MRRFGRFQDLVSGKNSTMGPDRIPAFAIRELRMEVLRVGDRPSAAILPVAGSVERGLVRFGSWK